MITSSLLRPLKSELFNINKDGEEREITEGYLLDHGFERIGDNRFRKKSHNTFLIKKDKEHWFAGYGKDDFDIDVNNPFIRPIDYVAELLVMFIFFGLCDEYIDEYIDDNDSGFRPLE